MKKRMGGGASTGGMPRALALGTGFAVIVSLGLTALAATAMSQQWIPERGAVYAVVVILIGSSCGGAWIAEKSIRRIDCRWLWGRLADILRCCWCLARCFFAGGFMES